MSKLDNIDYIRGLFIMDIYSRSKKNEEINTEKNDSFQNKPLKGSDIEQLYKREPRLKALDDKYLKNGNYHIGVSVVSKSRVLKNLFNYIGDKDALIESIRYKSKCRDIEEVIKIVGELPKLEMSDNDAKLSKGV